MRHWKKWVAVLAVAALIAVLVWRFDFEPVFFSVLEVIDGLGFWAPLVFVLVFMVATVFFMPGSILSMSAGALFGFVQGGLLAWIGALMGATAAFFVGRHFARDWLERKIKRHPKMLAIDKAVSEEGWRIVLLTRLSPVFPFKLLNYGFGLTRVSWSGYFFASAGGILPGTLVHVYIGTLIRWGVTGRDRTPIEWASFGFGLAATLAAAIYFSWLAEKEIKKRIPEEEERLQNSAR